MHATTRLFGGWRAIFRTSVVSEFREKACGCHTPFFFICRSLNLANVIQSPSQNPSQNQEFLPISGSFTQSIQEDSYNGNGNPVHAFSPSSSESSLISQMQTSIHDNDLSSNNKSKRNVDAKVSMKNNGD